MTGAPTDAVLALVGFVLSAAYSGMETGIYTLNRVRLAVRAARGERAAKWLRRELADPSLTISTLLIGTNASSYLASYGIAAILHEAGLGDWTLIAVEAAVFTPLLFVFAETLPKDLFRTHTDHWTYGLCGFLRLSRWLFLACGLLPIVHLAGTLASRLLGAARVGAVPARQHISQLIKEGVRAGVISESQTTLADRALALRGRTVATEMVPWSRAVRIPASADRAAREAIIRRSEFTRYPVVDPEGRVVGVLSSLDALLEPDRPTSDLAAEPMTLPATASVREALETMRLGSRAIAIAMDASGRRALGLVTLKDLVEPLTGELATW